MLGDIEKIPLKKFHLKKGDLFHGIKKSDKLFYGFGEIYFSWINYNSVKAWKYHKEMHLNLIVPLGRVLFVFYDQKTIETKEFIVGDDNYARLSVPKNIWYGFKGLSKTDNLVVNVASVEHDDNEVLSKNLEEINYDWKLD